ncbi:MAG: sugar ABC transporter permease [Thermomicrobiales bacterium]|nr:sugar ABC transporter permease [Thermomicrobiales bacterium]MCA9879983.1 sugar ABC transporter permease [Thermomicrobiales bacterium]
MQQTAASTTHAATGGDALAVRRRGNVSLRRREHLFAYLSLLPAFLLVAVVIWYPVTQTIYHSFTDWNGAVSTWIGWENYERIVSNGELWLLLRNNLIFVVSVPGILLLSLVVTVLLHEQVAGWRFFRSVYYLPTILSAAVVGTLMRVMFNSQGVTNRVLGNLGLSSVQHDWLGQVPTAFLVLIFAFYWTTLGQGVLIFLAGLASIPSELLDAARLDGAGWWNRLFKIIIPLLVPAIAYFVLTNVIWIFVGLFALVFTVTKGGPGYATTPFDLMIYRKAFESGELGYASALSVILFCIVLVISAAQLRMFDRLTTDA